MRIHPELCNCKKCKRLNRTINNNKHSTKHACGSYIGLIFILLAVL